jgi:hypothetical protein
MNRRNSRLIELRMMILPVLVLAATVLVVLLLGWLRGDYVSKASTQKENVSGDNIWQDVDESRIVTEQERKIIPNAYRVTRMNKAALEELLDKTPMEFTNTEKVVLSLPMPNGTMERFAIEETSVIQPAVSYFKTYRGRGLDDPTALLDFSLSLSGFHAQILRSGETVYINPYTPYQTDYVMSFYRKNYQGNGFEFSCLTKNNESAIERNSSNAPSVTNGNMLRTYRLAVAATGEFTAFHRQPGDTDVQAKQRAFDAIGVGVVRMNVIFERDLSLRFTLINNQNIIYTDANTDPYSGNDINRSNQNQTVIDNAVGTANYDIGHLVDAQGAGVATSPSTCDAQTKAQGKSGVGMPVGDPFYIDYVAHEIGHQYGADHAYNGVNAAGEGGCTTRAAMEAYEPSSGNSIMSYCGICGALDLQQNADAMFNVKGLEIMVDYTNNGGGQCGPATGNNNTPPTVNALQNYNIPRSTPFALTAAASDANNDALTYSWEQYDLGPQEPPFGEANGQIKPIFRNYAPNASPSRTFPSMQYVLNNGNIPPETYDCGRGAANPCRVGEYLPALQRTMNFQVVVRDGRSGINSATTQVTVNAGQGPFDVTQPNTNVSWTGGTNQTVTWSVNGTDGAPINAANVKISLSTDGGQTFPITILASTPNDGTENITVPNNATTQARVKVEAVGNIFFDVSNVNFTITPGTTTMPAKFVDFDGDRKTDISIFRPSVGQWWYQQSSDNVVKALAFGSATDRITPGDYDGDSKTDVAFWRPSTGEWFVLRSSNLTFFAAPFGATNDVPAPGDFDGDRKTDLAVFRPSNTTWFILRSSDNGVQAVPFGLATDIPTVEDYDGDGRSDIGIFRPAGGSGGGEWWILRSTAGLFATPFGTATDKPVQGDYTGDGKADIAFYRPTTSEWFILRSEDLSFFAAPFGANGDIPVAGDYDGDNKYDLAVFRPTNVTWFILKSTGGTQIQAFGAAGDKPVPSAFVP